MAHGRPGGEGEAPADASELKQNPPAGVVDLGALTPAAIEAIRLRFKNPGMTQQAAALKAGYKNGNALTGLKRRPEVRLVVSNILDKAGAKIERSARAIAEAHEAETVKYFADKSGHVVDERRSPDHTARLKAAELNAKWRGIMKEPGEDSQTNILAILARITVAARERGLPIEGQAGA